MCKGNYKLSKKVSKVFVKAINSSNYDNVKNYLKALKPFIKVNDEFKMLKLEWVFGVSTLVSRKAYRDSTHRYGLELVEKIGDDSALYVSPISNGPIEDALLSQLLKCKGKHDTFAVNCLKEMVSLMAKDEDIARYVYNSAPYTYQYSRYSDWIRPYLQYQKSDVEKSNAYTYFKAKLDTINKTLTLLE